MPNVITQSGIDWFYDLEGQGEPLIFLHGWGVDRRIWRQQTKYFSQFYQTVAIDLPGHGKSSWKKVSLKQMAEDLKEIFEKLGFKRLTIVGSSLGGLLALKFYEIDRSLIRRMTFVGSMPKFARSKDYPYGLDVGQIRKLHGQLNIAYPSVVNIFFRSLFTKEERESRRFKWLQVFRQNIEVPLQNALVEYLDVLETEDLRHVLQAMTIPLQFINGTHDEICCAKTVEYLRTLSPRSRFDFFQNCGHFPFLSKPHEFNEVLEKFLKETEC